MGKNLEEVKVENKKLKKDYYKNKRKSLFFGLQMLIVAGVQGWHYYQTISFNNELYNVLFKLTLIVITLLGTTSYAKTTLKDYFFIKTFISMEEYFYKLKQQGCLDREETFYKFQRTFDTFRRKLLLNVRGLNNFLLLNRDVFDIRENKVKKEIEVYFAYITEIIFNENFLKNPKMELKFNESEIEDFFESFKKTFISYPEAVNLISLQSFFVNLNSHAQSENSNKYIKITKEVEQYYEKNQLLLERRSERKFELLKSTITSVFGTFVAILIAFFISKILFG